MYKDNPDVVFVDVSLNEVTKQGDFRGPPNNPGSGGWPTIRYYNSVTGIDGGSYTKLTKKPMCEELGGNRMLLMDYIENYGNTILCDAVNSDDNGNNRNCNEKELNFIEKYKLSDITVLQSQLDRLNQMNGLNTELQHWVYRRIRILNQLVLLKQTKLEEEEEESSSEGGGSAGAGSGEEESQEGGSSEL